MFEKFSEKAKRVLFLARYEASQMGSRVIGTEHLLLGLLKEGEEITRELFHRSNIAIEMLRAELEEIGPSQERMSTSVEIPFSEETKRALAHAEEEANRRIQNFGYGQHVDQFFEISTIGRFLYPIDVSQEFKGFNNGKVPPQLAALAEYDPDASRILFSFQPWNVPHDLAAPSVRDHYAGQ